MTNMEASANSVEEPVSQLFLSCDLTGSTNFKQTASREVPWQKVFLQFYREFPQQVATTQVELESQDLDFKLWKPVGDELIYSCKVSCEADVYRAVRTWVVAMKNYEKESLDDTSLGTKGGAFIATFPGPDSRSSVPKDPRLEDSDRDVVELNRRAHESLDYTKYLYDYFGPSIDTGFRVLGKCSARYFTLSVEVALAMVGKSLTPDKDKDFFSVEDLSLLDFVELKGVWGGKRYPVVAIDLMYEDPVNLAYSKMLHRPTTVEIHELCQACYTSEGWPSKLYLPKSSNSLFHDDPSDPLDGYHSVTSQGAESASIDEPEDAADLVNNPPLGDE